MKTSYGYLVLVMPLLVHSGKVAAGLTGGAGCVDGGPEPCQDEQTPAAPVHYPEVGTENGAEDEAVHFKIQDEAVHFKEGNASLVDVNSMPQSQHANLASVCNPPLATGQKPWKPVFTSRDGQWQFACSSPMTSEFHNNLASTIGSLEKYSTSYSASYDVRRLVPHNNEGAVSNSPGNLALEEPRKQRWKIPGHHISPDNFQTWYYVPHAGMIIDNPAANSFTFFELKKDSRGRPLSGEADGQHIFDSTAPINAPSPPHQPTAAELAHIQGVREEEKKAQQRQDEFQNMEAMRANWQLSLNRYGCCPEQAKIKDCCKYPEVTCTMGYFRKTTITVEKCEQLYREANPAPNTVQYGDAPLTQYNTDDLFGNN